MLLFIVLIFIFPLKFLSLFLLRFLGMIFWKAGDVFTTMIEGSQVPLLVIYYGVGVLGILFVLSRFYKHALRKKEELELNNFEFKHTQYYKRLFSHLCFVPIISMAFVLSFMYVDVTLASIISGMLYSITGVVFVINQRWLRKQKQ